MRQLSSEQTVCHIGPTDAYRSIMAPFKSPEKRTLPGLVPRVPQGHSHFLNGSWKVCITQYSFVVSKLKLVLTTYGLKQ